MGNALEVLDDHSAVKLNYLCTVLEPFERFLLVSVSWLVGSFGLAYGAAFARCGSAQAALDASLKRLGALVTRVSSILDLIPC